MLKILQAKLQQYMNQELFKFLKEMGITLPASWETCMQIKKQQLESDMEQWTGSKLGKEYVRAVYCHPARLTSMQKACFVLSCFSHVWLFAAP